MKLLSFCLVLGLALTQALHADVIIGEERLLPKNPLMICRSLQGRLEAERVKLMRLENDSQRRVAGAETKIKKCLLFLSDAKRVRRDAACVYPVQIGNTLYEEEKLISKVADVQEEIRFAERDRQAHLAVLRRVESMKKRLVVRERELQSQFRALLRQKELAEIHSEIGKTKDLVQIAESLKQVEKEIADEVFVAGEDDLPQEDLDARRRQDALNFLNN